MLSVLTVSLLLHDNTVLTTGVFESKMFVTCEQYLSEFTLSYVVMMCECVSICNNAINETDRNFKFISSCD